MGIYPYYDGGYRMKYNILFLLAIVAGILIWDANSTPGDDYPLALGMLKCLMIADLLSCAIAD